MMLRAPSRVVRDAKGEGGEPFALSVVSAAFYAFGHGLGKALLSRGQQLGDQHGLPLLPPALRVSDPSGVSCVL